MGSIFLKGSALEPDRADELERQLATANQQLSAAGLVQATAPMSSRLIAFDTETREAAEFIGASVAPLKLLQELLASTHRLKLPGTRYLAAGFLRAHVETKYSRSTTVHRSEAE